MRLQIGLSACCALLIAGCTLEAPALSRGPGSGGARSLDAGEALDATDATPIDTGMAADAADDAGADADLGFAEDAEVDAGALDAEPRDQGTPDAGFADAEPADTGGPTTPCQIGFSTVAVYRNLRDQSPAGAGDLSSPFLSSDERTFFAAVEVPVAGNSSMSRFNVYVYTRANPGQDWGPGRVTNLDNGGEAANQTDELDLRFFGAERRYWFTFVQGGYARIESAELQTAPYFFRDFTPETGGFPEMNQQYRGAALSADGLTLVSSHYNTASRAWNLVERGRPSLLAAWSAQTPLTALGSARDELDAWLSDDATLLLYASDRSGDWDILCSWRPTRADAWAPPIRFGGTALSAPGSDERAPFLVTGGLSRRLFLSRRVGPGPANIHVAQ